MDAERAVRILRARRQSGAVDEGTATAEMAVVLPALARGETSDQSVAVARAAAPKGARIVVSRSDDLVVVEVHAGVRLPGPWAGALPGMSLAGRAVAAVEGGTEPNGAIP